MPNGDTTATDLARKGRFRNKAATNERTPFGFELYLLAEAREKRRSIPDVVWSLCGSDSSGRAAAQHFFAALEAIDTRAGKLAALEHWLRTFEHARKHGSQWRASGAPTYVGRQHQKPIEVVDEATGEVRTKRPHWPARRGKSAGGIARNQRRSPRQLNRYRRTLRRVRLMASAQPDARASDATLPRRRRSDGTWAYAQHWLPFPPSSNMVRRWALAARKRNSGRRPAYEREILRSESSLAFAADVSAALQEMGVEH